MNPKVITESDYMTKVNEYHAYQAWSRTIIGKVTIWFRELFRMPSLEPEVPNVTFSWNTPPKATGYKVEYRTHDYEDAS